MTDHPVSNAPDESDVPGHASLSNAIDWRAMADKRLGRLVDLEHDSSLMRDRLQQLQSDYGKLLAVEEDRLQRIWELDRLRDRLMHQLESTAREHERMREAFLGSRSWRLTAPLRALHTPAASLRRAVGNSLRAMLRVPLIRRVAAAVGRRIPGLQKRLRARLYPRG